MPSVNKAILIGNLGQDPELRTAGTTQVCNFNIATTYKEDTQWHRIVTFGKTAENCAQYLKKGRQVYVEGRLQTREWEDKGGNKRTTTEIVAFQVVFLGQQQDRPLPAEEAPEEAPAKEEDDLPF